MIRRSSFLRIDDNVFFTMGGVLLFSLIVVAFKVATRTECKPIMISVKEGPYFTGELIVFKASSKDAKSFAWDFGDDSPVEKTGAASTTHAYKTSGKFTISLIVNGKCSELYDIFISEMIPLPPKPQEMTFLVDKPTAYINQPVTFTDTISSHYKWEWHTVESEDIAGVKNEMIYKFSTTGSKEVWVKVNGKDEMRYTVNIVEDPKEREMREQARIRQQANPGQIIVIPENSKEPALKPVTDDGEPGGKTDPTPAGPTQYPAVSNQQMEGYIKELSQKKIGADFFNKFFCEPDKIVVNYEGKQMPLQAFLGKVQETRIKKVKAQLGTQQGSNCIQSLKVSINEKGFLKFD